MVEWWWSGGGVGAVMVERWWWSGGPGEREAGREGGATSKQASNQPRKLIVSELLPQRWWEN